MIGTLSLRPRRLQTQSASSRRKIADKGVQLTDELKSTLAAWRSGAKLAEIEAAKNASEALHVPMTTSSQDGGNKADGPSAEDQKEQHVADPSVEHPTPQLMELDDTGNAGISQESVRQPQKRSLAERAAAAKRRNA